MKKILLSMLIAICSMSSFAQVSKMVGEWYTIDDKTNEKKAVVQIYKEKDGLYYGKIIQSLIKADGAVCVACTGEDANKPIVGLTIVRGFKEKDGALVGGRVLDPESGKYYYGKITMDGEKLVLRGSIDKMGVLGRSQTWIKKK